MVGNICPTGKTPQWRLAHHEGLIHRAPELSASPMQWGLVAKAHVEIAPWASDSSYGTLTETVCTLAMSSDTYILLMSVTCFAVCEQHQVNDVHFPCGIGRASTLWACLPACICFDLALSSMLLEIQIHSTICYGNAETPNWTCEGRSSTSAIVYWYWDGP